MSRSSGSSRESPDPSYGISPHYVGESGAAYHELKLSDEASGTFYVSRKFAHLVRPEHTVLDFGAGAGDGLAGLACRRKVAVEPNSTSRDRCAQRGLETYGDLADVPDAVADLIITHHALEHVPYPIEALRQLRPKLRPDGRLAVCVPINDWRKQRRYDPGDPNHHFHTWTSQLLGNTLREAGYDVRSTDIKIVNRTRPGRLTRVLFRVLPAEVFLLVCRVWSVATRRRELHAVARLPVKS